MASHQLETRSLLCEKLGVKQLKETCIDQYANNFLSISGQKNYSSSTILMRMWFTKYHKDESHLGANEWCLTIMDECHPS
jgi:hypothetical protein